MIFVKKVLSAISPMNWRAPETTSKPASTFGGFRKRTMTARDFIVSTVSLAPETATLYKVWVKHDIDPGFREELMLAVSKLNDCRYCSWAHHEWAHIASVPEEELAQIEEMDLSNFDRKKWIAISFVRELVSAGFGAVSKDLMKEMKSNYSADEIREITLVAKVMDMSNRGANTWDSMRSRLRGQPAAESRLLDEAILSAVFLTVAPMVILFLARASKRSFAEMARSMFDYTRHAKTRDDDSTSI